MVTGAFRSIKINILGRKYKYEGRFIRTVLFWRMFLWFVKIINNISVFTSGVSRSCSCSCLFSLS